MRQVEVLRGPQSLVRGQNAVAGAIVMRSNDPTQEWEGAVRLGAGNQKTRNGALMVSGPIVKNNLAFRLSAERQQRESYEPFVHYDPAGNPRRVENTNIRFKLLFTPEAYPNFLSRLTFNYIKSRAPQNEIMGNTASARFLPQKPVFETGSRSGIWDVSWQINDSFKLENKLVYARYDNDRIHLPMSVHPQGVPATLRGHEVQWEPVLHYRPEGGSVKGLAGLYFFRSSQDETVDIRSVGGRNEFSDANRVYAAFAEADWQFAPQWNLTLAGRLEREEHQRHGGGASLRLDLDKGQTVFLPKIDLSYRPSEHFTAGLKLARGYNPGGAGITFGRPVLTYTYQPEYINNIELYTRWRTPDRRLELSGNLFANRYKDMQLPFYLGPSSVVIRNANSVQTYGAEMQAGWQALDSLRLTAGLGLLHTDIRRYPGSGIEGNRLGRAPRYTATLGVTWKHPSGWEAGGDARFSGGYYSAANNAEVGRIKRYGQLNLYAAYNFKHGRVSMYADNVFNSRRPIFVSTNDRHDSLYQRPRAIGVSTELRF
ncbi:TonB-dependent receptor [Eikenella corrodens]|nr:TonB-dependent receptor [Eikenella corrodens]